MTLQVSFYARVSSEKQMKNCTIDSQILALENRIHVDGYVLPDEFKFIDNGYSGSNIVRPALERLRDKVAAAEIDKIYIHSPDRLARKCATYLLQGLVVCHQCQCAYSGITRKSGSGTYGYYRCAGNDSHRCGGEKICQNKAVRIDTLEAAIWEEVKCLLKNPTRLLEEFERRLSKLDKPSLGEFYLSLTREKSKIEKGISRLIDSYVQEYIDKSEF